MLLKSRISDIGMIETDQDNDKIKFLSEVWKNRRIGRFTSSPWHKLMGEEGFGKIGLGYIRTRVFESLSGVSSDKDILNESIVRGIIYENTGLRKFAIKKGLDFLVTQKLIFGETDLESTTPDGLIIRKESLDRLSYDASTVEMKCFEAERHMECIEAENAQQLRKIDFKTYSQALHQMHVCDCLTGYVVYFHPDLNENEGGLHIIELRKMQQLIVKGKITYPINEDLQLLKTRKDEAFKLFHEKRDAQIKKGQPLRPA